MNENTREAFALPVVTNRQHTLFGYAGVALLRLPRCRSRPGLFDYSV